MAWVIENSGYQMFNNTASPSMSITTPAAGNLLVGIVGRNNGSGTTTATGFDGFTLLEETYTGNDQVRNYFCYKIADGTETALTHSWASGKDETGMFYIEVSGGDAIEPYDVSDHKQVTQGFFDFISFPSLALDGGLFVGGFIRRRGNGHADSCVFDFNEGEGSTDFTTQVSKTISTPYNGSLSTYEPDQNVFSAIIGITPTSGTVGYDATQSINAVGYFLPPFNHSPDLSQSSTVATGYATATVGCTVTF